MNKRMLLAVAVIFVAWAIMDFIIHGVLLQAAYAATADLWRPMEEFNVALMYLVTLLGATVFTVIYAQFISPKGIGTGIIYGALFGLWLGASAGFLSYCYMPIPLSLAWSWFAAALAKMLVAGTLVGAIVKSK